MEWGPRLPTLLQYVKTKKKTPQALLDRPVLKFHHREWLNHYYRLANSRTYSRVLVNTEKGSIIKTIPNPIDIGSILSYNSEILGGRDPEFFIDLIQSLDQNYMKSFKG